jgi:hypothetical protein
MYRMSIIGDYDLLINTEEAVWPDSSITSRLEIAIMLLYR